jgi:hypothetical protein
MSSTAAVEITCFDVSQSREPQSISDTSQQAAQGQDLLGIGAWTNLHSGNSGVYPENLDLDFGPNGNWQCEQTVS